MIPRYLKLDGAISFSPSIKTPSCCVIVDASDLQHDLNMLGLKKLHYAVFPSHFFKIVLFMKLC